jgi:hypothetical protein
MYASGLVVAGGAARIANMGVNGLRIHALEKPVANLMLTPYRQYGTQQASRILIFLMFSL